jgi:hypothetical protein
MKTRTRWNKWLEPNRFGLILGLVAVIGVVIYTYYVNRKESTPEYAAEQLRELHTTYINGGLEKKTATWLGAKFDKGDVVFPNGYSPATPTRFHFDCKRVVEHVARYANALNKKQWNGSVEDYKKELGKLPRSDWGEMYCIQTVLGDLTRPPSCPCGG